jgi:hypothetical protein
MRLWKSIISGICGIVLSACARDPASMSIQSAGISADTLLAQISWRPDPNLLDALDHGIPLDFIVTLKAKKSALLGIDRTIAEQQRRVQLRYYPLSRYYQFRDLDLDQTHNFPARASALAALENIRIPLKAWNATSAERYQLDIAIDRAALPGVLRMSSLVRPDWWLDSGAFTWPAAVD